MGRESLMGQQLTIAPVGLFTDPNPLSAVPDGAMTEALNVVITRPGVVEPRPGLQEFPYTTILVDEDIIAIVPFEDDLLIFAKDASSGVGHAYWFLATDDMVQAGSFIGADSSWTFTVGQVHGAVIGGNLYVTCGEGVFRCSAPGDDNAYRAGLPRPAQAQVTSATTGGVNYPLVADRSVGYRLCTTATAGRLTLRSPPSARIVQRSYTGAGAKRVTLDFANTSTDVVEVYRSSALGGTDDAEPTDEMVMIGTAAASSASFTDDEAFTDFVGPSLYVNATQGGAVLENGITPFCRDVAAYRDMLFFGAARWAPSLTFEVLGFGDAWRGTNLATANRLTSFTVTATTTNTSTTVSGVSASDIAKVRVGMRVYLDTSNPTTNDANFPADTYVETVNTGAGTFTITNAATASTVGATVRLSDWIEVSVVDNSGTDTERVFCDDASGTNYIDAREFRADTAANVRGPQQMAYELSDELDGKATVSAFGDGATTAWTFIVETYGSDVTSLTVKTSNANAISSRIDGTTGKTGQERGSVATLAWSKPGELEHVPPGYFAEIGAPDKAIERVIAARDSLFVFKEDGVWRVSGYSPDTLQIDEYDRTMRLIHPDAACEWDGMVAAWTNKGVRIIGDGGSQEISTPIRNIIEAAGNTHAGQNAMGVQLCGWVDRGLLLLSIPADESTGYAEYIYCWSQRTGAWTRWTHEKPITSAGILGPILVAGTKAPSAAARASILINFDESYDITTSVTVSAATGTLVVISAGSGWTPAVGDILRQSSVDYAVTEVESATRFYVHQSGVTAAVAAALTRTPMRVAWTVRDAKNAGVQKHWRESTLLLGSASGLVSNDNSFTSDRSATAGTSSTTFDYTVDDEQMTIRTRVPREARRCGRLAHQLTLTGAKPGWALHGASYVYEPMGTRFPDAA
jgi:hypothetical protein